MDAVKKNTSNKMREWAEQWRRVAPELERIREEEIRCVNVASAIELLEDAFQSALLLHPPAATSGLVEQGNVFKKVKT